MPVFWIVAVAVGLVAVRCPIVDHLAGWLVLLPLMTLSIGTIAWTIFIWHWDAAFSVHGYAMTLAAFAVPVAFGVKRLN